MNSLQNVKRTIIFISFFTFVLFGALISYSHIKFIDNEIEKDVDTKTEFIQKNYELFLKELTNNTFLKINILLESEEIVKSFNDKNRDLLYSLVKKNFDLMVKENPYLKMMTFRLADGSAFLRLHKPTMYGDSLNQKRIMVLDTIKTQKPQYGFEVGKLHMSFRVMVPIFYKKSFIGLVEVGIIPEYITSKIQKITDVKTALLVKDEFSDVLLDTTNLKKSNNWVLARGDKLFFDKFKELDFSKKTLQLNYKNEKYYLEQDLNLLNNKEDIIAKILIAFDIQKYLDE